MIVDDQTPREQLAAAALVIVFMSVIATVGFRTIFSTSSYLAAAYVWRDD